MNLIFDNRNIKVILFYNSVIVKEMEVVLNLIQSVHQIKLKLLFKM